MTEKQQLQAERKDIKERISALEGKYDDAIWTDIPKCILDNEKHDLEIIEYMLKMIEYNEYVERSYKEYGEDVRLMPLEKFIGLC